MADHTQRPDDGGTTIPPPSDEKPTPLTIRPAEKKTETSRIDLSKAVPPEGVKRPTLRVDLPAGAKSETQKVKSETQKVSPASLHQTMRVEVPEMRKLETTRITLPPEALAGTTGARPPSTEDVFKRATIPVGIPTPPPKPKTLSVKKPVGIESAPMVEPTPEAVSEAKKSETARLDLSDAAPIERPPTRKKTIMIKRPDAEAVKKPLVIARAETEQATLPTVEAAQAVEEVGTPFSIIALVAMLVLFALLYVMLADHTMANLPFPGRI